MADAPQIPDRVALQLARRVTVRAQRADARAAFGRRRAAGLRSRHAAKLAR